MRKVILMVLIGSSFIYADCDSYIRSSNSSNQSACVKATECLKNETTQLAERLNELEIISKNLNNELKSLSNNVARCENYKAYAIENPRITRWKTLAQDCETHYNGLANKLVSAKRNLNTIGKKRAEQLRVQVGVSEASLVHIKAKCNP